MDDVETIVLEALCEADGVEATVPVEDLDVESVDPGDEGTGLVFTLDDEMLASKDDVTGLVIALDEETLAIEDVAGVVVCLDEETLLTLMDSEDLEVGVTFAWIGEDRPGIVIRFVAEELSTEVEDRDVVIDLIEEVLKDEDDLRLVVAFGVEEALGVGELFGETGEG